MMRQLFSRREGLSFHSPVGWLRLLTYTFAFLVATVSLLGMDCSSGTDDSDAGGGTAPPVLRLTIQSVNTFHFTWADVTYEEAYVLLENPDGASGYSEIATLALNNTSFDLSVSLPDRINASYILQACNFGGCIDSSTVFVSNILAGIGYFKASNTDASDQFGSSVALSGDGNTLAVGTTSEQSWAVGVKHPNDADYVSSQANNSYLSSGAVYVFARNGLLWQQQAYIKSLNNDAFDRFASSIALSDDGNTLAVGAPGEDGNSISGMNDNSAPESGAVYIYSRAGEVWSPDFYLKASNPGDGDFFGAAIALSGDGLTLAVGAKNEDSGVIGDPGDNSVTDSGAAYVFVNDASFWYQQAYLKAPLIGLGDQLGWALALSHDGNTLVVSSINEDSNGLNPNDNSARQSGAVYIFTRSGMDWNGPHYLKASNAEENDSFGASVALSNDGMTLAVGAPWEDSNGTSPSDNSLRDSGAAYIFTRDGSGWQQRAYLKATNIDAGDALGWTLALSAEEPFTLAVGAQGEQSDAIGIDGDQTDNSFIFSGAVYIYKGMVHAMTPYAYVKASNTGDGDYFGGAIGLSNNGDTLVVGASNEDSRATGVGGDQFDDSAIHSGAVYMY